MATRRIRKRPEAIRRPSRLRVLVFALAASAAATASAQTNEFTPTLDTRVTWTDSGGSSGGGGPEWVFEIAPGVEVVRESGRATGAFSARLRNLERVRNLFASRDSDRSQSFIELSGAGTYEAIENFLFIDADASISRDNTSSFSGRSRGDPLATDKNDEQRVFSIGPRIEFGFGENGRGSARYLARWYDGARGELAEERVDQWNAGLSDPTAFGRVGWGLAYSRTDTQYDGLNSEESLEEIGRATVFFGLMPELRLRGIAGYERNDYAGNEESGSIYGGGFDWTPNSRTSLSATVEDRLFGTGYDVQFNHRMPRLEYLPSSHWQLSFTRDIQSNLETLAGGFLLDPRFQNLLALFNDPVIVALYPDEADRRRRLVELYESIGGNFDPLRSNLYYLERAARAALSLIGARNVLTLSYDNSDRERLNTLSGSFIGDRPEDELAIFGRVRTSSLTLSLTHRLSGLSAINASISREKAEGSESEQFSDLEADRTWLRVGFVTRLSPDATGELSYSHQRTESDGNSSTSFNDFTENAITATLAMRF